MPFLVVAAGCERSAAPPEYRAVSGSVEACQPDTGELTVRQPPRELRTRGDEPLHCVITKDSEIYVNDRFTTIRDIETGDRVELIGYRDPSPQQERFVVTYGYVLHPLEKPPLPEILAGLTTRPAKESQP